MNKMGSLILPLTHSVIAVEREAVYSAKHADRRSSEWTPDDRAIVDGRLADGSGNNFVNQAKSAYPATSYRFQGRPLLQEHPHKLDNFVVRAKPTFFAGYVPGLLFQNPGFISR
jgi:hypothetical protein